MRYAIVLLALAAVTSSTQAWNNKGHMTVARVAWNELKAEERKKVVEILKSHPHYEEFLRGQRPDNMTEDEWVFMRAATWADWVRNGPPERRKYSVPTRHYTDIPFVPKGNIKAPAPSEENVVTGIDSQLKKATAGERVERAVAVTWLFHLVGDIHQPLHSTSRYDEDFPTGDRGGNRAVVRIRGGNVVHLHSFWDGLLGSSTSRSSILGTVKEIEGVVADNLERVNADLEANTTPESWAKESHKLAVEFVYERGMLRPANGDDDPDADDIPTTKADYAENAGEVARLGAFKGGRRLAKLLRKVLDEN